MAIPLMEEDVEVISQLGDTPGSDDGLTPQQLKERFDLAGIRIKNFLNNVLIPHMNQLVDVQALLNGILDKDLSKEDKAANAKVTGDKIAEVRNIANAALPKSGGIMAGPVNMNNQKLANVPVPVNEYDAANKQYVDSRKVCATIQLAANGWADKTQKVDNVAVTQNSAIFVGYATECVDACRIADIRCVGQEDGRLTFTCRWVPRDNLTVNVIIWN